MQDGRGSGKGLGDERGRNRNVFAPETKGERNFGLTFSFEKLQILRKKHIPKQATYI